MTPQNPPELSRRERQIMDVIFRRGRATVAEVLEELEDAPSYSAVRATLGVLEGKGLLTHRKAGRRFVYESTTPRSKAQRSAMIHLLRTFFDDSAEGAVAALLKMRSSELDAEALERIRKLIENAEKEGR